MEEKGASCAHLKVSWRTEQFQGYVEPTDETPGGMHTLTRGWWECDSNCGMKFWPSLEPVHLHLNYREAIAVHQLHLIGAKFILAEYNGLDYMRYNVTDFLDVHFSDEDADALRNKITWLGDCIPEDELAKLGIIVQKLEDIEKAQEEAQGNDPSTS